MIIEAKKVNDILSYILLIFLVIVCIIFGVFIGAYITEMRYGDNLSYSANEFLDLDIADLEEIEGKEMRISDVYVEEVITGSTGMFVETEVGTVFFKDDEDALKVRAGETFIFKGQLSIDLDGKTSFHQSDYIMRKGD